MGDVTFGVKVSEEMKNELSQLMKEHTLSGKEFMSMLLASYHLDKAREETQLFESDIVELQNLTKRIQGIFLNMTEKSKVSCKEELDALKKVIETQQTEKDEWIKTKDALEVELKEAQVKENEAQKREETLCEKVSIAYKEIEVLKKQLENNLLLHHKFEEEASKLKEQIKSYKRLEVEIEERNNENTKLKERNDEIASEIWFLQREVEKLQKEIQQLHKKYEDEKNITQTQFDLKLSNALLNQQLEWQEKNNSLKEEILSLKEEKVALEKQYHRKLEEFLGQMVSTDQKK